jgi:hypothetical protein
VAQRVTGAASRVWRGEEEAHKQSPDLNGGTDKTLVQADGREWRVVGELQEDV